MKHDDLLKARIWTLGALDRLMDLGLIDRSHVNLKTSGMHDWEAIDQSDYRPQTDQIYRILAEPNSGIAPASRNYIMKVLIAFSLPFSRKAMIRATQKTRDKQ